MVTSSGAGPGGGGGSSFGRRAWGYLESTRNLVGCAAGAAGLGLHFAGFGGALWPGVVAGLYGAGVLLWPVKPGPPPPPPREPWPELAELAEYLRGVPLPVSAGLDGLLERLAEVGRRPDAVLIVGGRLPVAVDGYLRARTWERWRAGAPDPGAVLAGEVESMTAALAG
ncbi:hypothetical protein ACFVHB_11745 [Kitasatospora sp. NPDC127111]|uniref:hypothetical protein n=1 Tax=Kitasatospora sp. NPDC127111 TaxID=3345363 RepID=UPI003631139C